MARPWKPARLYNNDVGVALDRITFGGSRESRVLAGGAGPVGVKSQRENPGDEVIIHAIPQEAFVAALKDPNTMIISDGLVFPNLVAQSPRLGDVGARVGAARARAEIADADGGAAQDDTDAGAAARDAGAGDEEQGRLRVGADADLAIFDPETVGDSAKFGDPAKYSVGFRHVLVAGVPVVSNGELQTGVTPGRAVRGSIKD